MESRYAGRPIFRNSNEIYRELLERKGLNFIRQYGTPEYKQITEEDVLSVSVVAHIWKVGDRYEKLAAKHYGDPRLWFVIAWFNQRPTEAHNALGDTLLIPMPLQAALRSMGI